MSAPSFDPRTTAGPSLEAALDRLVDRGTLGRDQADAVLAELAEAALGAVPGATTGAVVGSVPSTAPGSPGNPPATPFGGRPGRAWTAVLAEVGGYVGAAFVIAAAIVFTGPRWEQLSHAAQIAVFAVPAMLALLAAVLLAQAAPGRWTPLPQDDLAQEGLGQEGLGPRRRLVAALIGTGGALLAGTVAVTLPDNFADGYGEAEACLSFLAACAVWALGYVFCRIALLHVGIAGAAAAALSSGIAWFYREDSTAWTGAALAGLALVWAGLAAGRVLAERQLGFGVAGVLGFLGGEMLATESTGSGWGYLVLLAIAVAGLAGYVRTRMITVLVVGVAALGTVVPQAIIDYTDGALGAAGALLVTGLSIVGASVLGLRLHREVPGRHG